MGTDLRFYHLETTTLEQVLPALLKKVLEQRGQRALVRVSSPERAEALSAQLWTQDPGGFLPHGTPRDGKPERQPIWITADSDNPNRAEILFVADGADDSDAENFDLCAEIFDGSDDEAVAKARERWTAFRARGLTPTYYQQTAKGWEKKT